MFERMMTRPSTSLTGPHLRLYYQEPSHVLMCEGREWRDCCENVFFKPAYVHAIRLFENAIQSMSAPTGALSGPDVFIPIFADV